MKRFGYLAMLMALSSSAHAAIPLTFTFETRSANQSFATGEEICSQSRRVSGRVLTTDDTDCTDVFDDPCHP